MADDQFSTSGNWWDTERNRYDSGASQSSSSGLTTMVNFAWQSDMVDMKPRSMAVSGSSPMVFHDNIQKLQTTDSAGTTDPNLHMMALGLSNEPMDWNQPSLLRGEKAPESSFRSMLQDNMNSSSTNFQQETGVGLSQVQWREKMYFGGCTADESTTNEFKQVNRGFSLDQPHHQFSPQYSSGDSTITCQGLPSSFQMEPSPIYGNPSVLQGVLGSGHGNQAHQPPINLSYPTSYGFNNNSSTELVPSWSKVPQFLRSSPPKQASNNQLHFTNDAPFWNASEPVIKDVRPSLFPSLQSPFSAPHTQSKNISSEVRNSNVVGKKNGSTETASKRPRNETSSPMPDFKVRKEKMGDRITALQQLVSPFGKTDTASVLSESIEYIKFLHEQVTALSSPYMKSGGSMQNQQQNSGKSMESGSQKQDLRTRGLCLVPVSSTFPVTHENPVDIWIPTFGGTFR